MRTLNLPSDRIAVREAADGDTLTIEGRAVPFSEPIDYAGIREMFAPGAFAVDDVIGAPLLWSHDRSEPVGHITDATSSDEGLDVVAVIQNTARGRDAMALLRGGSLKGLSVGFTPTETRETAQGLTYTRASLIELSLTPVPAYKSAQVHTTREEAPMPETTETRETAEVDLAPINERIEQLETLLARQAQPAQTRQIQPVEALAMQLRDAVEHKQVRALGDVISSGNAGVLPPSWSSLLRGYLDGNRYLAPRLGSLGFPATGHTLTVPKITQEPSVGPRGTELTAIPGQSMTTGSDPYSAQWISGGVRLALELIEQSSPEASAVAVQRLLLAYNREVDDYLGTQLANAGSPTGSVLDFTSYGTFVDSVLDAAHLIRGVTGAFGDKLALTQESFKKLIGLVDADGRRVLSVSGPANADGSTALTSLSVSVGGVECFYYEGIEDMQFNTMSAAYAEKPPMTLSEVEVGVMGRSIGVLGAVIALPLYPTGILVHSVA